ncbi:Aste57867_11876 [Aphanomyces stellatus]|uniref:Aste57867_11876 protein n=1 Tax=Aphanomyces stellatus TaxID=120398 RepID=A0A485KUJ8_9STRA|nr:hypothetical protein As57867_011831 [Aphanomyces stellatus]VFT88731.1 Aste57867_11876 [Aphanomyces stellatus]
MEPTDVFACKKETLDDKTKVELLYERLLVVQSSYAELEDTALSQDDKIDNDKLRLRMDLHAKKEQCEALERALKEVKDANERLVEMLSGAQRAWNILEHEFQAAKDTHEQQSQDFRDVARSWEAKLMAESAQHATDVQHFKAKLERFHAQDKGGRGYFMPRSPGPITSDDQDLKSATLAEPSRFSKCQRQDHESPRNERTSDESLVQPSLEPSLQKTRAANRRTQSAFEVANLPPLTPANEFEWADGTRHVVPETWVFPSVTCRDLWVVWFRGDGQVRPFRQLRTPQLGTQQQKTMFVQGFDIMRQLIGIATVGKWVASEDAMAKLAPGEFLTLFTKTFDLLTGKSDDGTKLTQRGFTQIHPASVHALRQPNNHRVSRLGQNDSVHFVEPTELHQPPGPNHMFRWPKGALLPFPKTWKFPATTCKEMWKYWFCGDKAANVRLFRLFGTVVIPPSHGQAQYGFASLVMTKLIGIAIDDKWVSSVEDIARLEMPELMTLFAKSFVVLTSKLTKSLPGLKQLRQRILTASSFQPWPR